MSLDWNNLLNQGRCKAFGVPWTEAEQEAIRSGIPAEFVRQGVLTKAQFEPVKDSKELKYQKKSDLQQEAASLGLQYSAITTRLELIEMIGLAKEGK